MKVSAYVGISMDGFLARMDGDFDWLSSYADEDATKAYESFQQRIDAIVLGRKTFEKVSEFPVWPYQKDVFVLSRTLKNEPEKNPANISILSMLPNDLIHFLQGKGFENLLVDGGQVIQEFLKERLLDEMIISTVPILIGSGIRLFDQVDNDILFTLMRSEVQSNGLVRNHYLRKAGR